MASDTGGNARPLSHPMVLASVLCAVDAERGRRTLLGGRGPERLEALSPVYWPLLVLPSPGASRVAVFDGTGAWSRTFTHTLFPSVDEVQVALARPTPTPELASWLRSLLPALTRDLGQESIAIEGALPTDLPLFADILAQSGFRTEPIPGSPGFLPSRHPWGWYASVVAEIGRSLDRFEQELRRLRDLRSAVGEFQAATAQRLDAEYERLKSETIGRARSFAYAEMDRESDAVHRSLREQVVSELERIRTANAERSQARAMARVAEAAGQRLSARGEDAAEARAQMRAAMIAVRSADRAIVDAHKRIEMLHERERQTYHLLTDRVGLVEEQAAQELAVHQIQRTEIGAACHELHAAIGGQIARRSAERDVLASQFVDAPALAGVR
ncbi:MAG: hypothetical protein L3J91_06690, partial [Thermoplasmata archaeon]|nr:hypothetical protein [Thermoplasmata archaeon]